MFSAALVSGKKPQATVGFVIDANDKGKVLYRVDKGAFEENYDTMGEMNASLGDEPLSADEEEEEREKRDHSFEQTIEGNQVTFMYVPVSEYCWINNVIAAQQNPRETGRSDPLTPYIYGHIDKELTTGLIEFQILRNSGRLNAISERFPSAPDRPSGENESPPL